MSESVKLSIAAWLACLPALAVLASLALHNELFQRFDARLVNRIVGQGHGTAAASLIVRLGDPIPQGGLLLVACLPAPALGHPDRALAAALLVAGANLTTQLLKLALSHPRYQPLLGYYQVGSSAFPSGHVTAIAAMTLAFALVAPRWWLPIGALGACLTIAVAWSVVVLHHHYPSDALAGVLVAFAWLFAVLAVAQCWRS